MKKVVIFEVENVMFDVKNVERGVKERLEKMENMRVYEKEMDKRKLEEYVKGSLVKCRMFEGFKSEIDRLEALRKSVRRMKVFVVSKFKRELVWRMLGNVGMEVDGVYESVDKVFREWDFEKSDVVCFVRDEERKRICEENGVKGIVCKWGGKFKGEEEDLEGLENVGEIWREIGLKVS